MTSEILDRADELRAIAAEALAERLNHWQIMDIVHVAKHDNIMLGAAHPWKPLDQLIQYGVLKFASATAKNRLLVKGHRFQAVLYALERAGRIATHRGMVL